VESQSTKIMIKKYRSENVSAVLPKHPIFRIKIAAKDLHLRSKVN
jgi:hypothetical protein